MYKFQYLLSMFYTRLFAHDNVNFKLFVYFQNLHEMTQLSGIENDSNFLEETEANIMAYKAQRLILFMFIYISILDYFSS